VESRVGSKKSFKRAKNTYNRRNINAQCGFLRVGGFYFNIHSKVRLYVSTSNNLVTMISKTIFQSSITLKRPQMRTIQTSFMVCYDFSKFDLILEAKIASRFQPFGGVQLILCGDFLQLPPVKGLLCFDAVNWKRAVPNVVLTKTVFRQSNSEFITLLNDLRIGKVTPQHYGKTIYFKC
jgi:ATP-dependent DNA helicase PIF1